MLILSRREAECVCLGDDVVLTIVSVGNDKVRIGVKAPSGVRILRRELEIVEKPAIITDPLDIHEPSESNDRQAAPLSIVTPEELIPQRAPSSIAGPLRAHLLNAAHKRRAA